VLRPVQRFDVVVELGRSLGEIGQIPVGQPHARDVALLLRDLDVMPSEAVADAAAARVQEQPYPVQLVE
jgi:hypothetical protein